MPHDSKLPTDDKATWLPGPWQTEPDRAEWRHNGIPCLITRAIWCGGNLCGYVAVSPGHPWHGRPAEKVPASAHGGITYAEKCAGHICHVPEPGESDNVWWIGFDCAHAFDYCPRLMSTLAACGERASRPLDIVPLVYRDWAYVIAEVTGLAQQVDAAAKRRAAKKGTA